MQFLDGSEAFRGCISDPIEDGRAFCIKNHEHCIRCRKRACNAQKLEFEKPLSCIKCTSNESNNCSIIDKNTTAIECNRTANGYKNVCYTHHMGQTITRGCLYEANDSIFDICKTNTSAVCSTCNQSDCNRKSISISNINIITYIPNVSKRNASYERTIRPNEEENRLLCYKCSGTEECDFMKDSNLKPKACLIASKHDQCFTFIHNKGYFS